MCAGFDIKRLGDQGKIQFAYLLFIAAFMVLLGFAVLENRMVIQVRDKIDNVLTVSGFSGTLGDFRKISDSMHVIKKNADGQIYYDFEEMYKNAAVFITEEGLEERVRSVLQKNLSDDGMMKKMITGYSLEDAILYNEPIKENTVAPNGMLIKYPSLYLRIKLNIKGIMGRIHTVYLDKCIVVKWNLQI